MYNSSSIGTHTLSLFGLQSSTKPIDVAATQAPRIAIPSGSIERTGGTPVSTGSGFVRPGVDENYLRIMDPVYQAKLKEIAMTKDAEKKEFWAANGYQDRTGVGKQIAATVSRNWGPGEMGFHNRETAMVTASNRIREILDTVANINEQNVMTSVPYARENRVIKYGWTSVPNGDAEARLAALPQELRDLAEKKRLHDIKAEDLALDMKLGEARRDFGIPQSVVSRTESGGAEVQDFDVMHSEFGKLAIVRDGTLFLIDSEGAEVQADNYEFDEMLFRRV